MTTTSRPDRVAARATLRPTPETRPAVLQEIVDSARAKGLGASSGGTLSTQVPGLDQVAPDHFAIAVALLDGTVISSGDAKTQFSLQSITKLFSLAALLQLRPDGWSEIGWEPTESSYRSLADLESRGGRPRNPFVNAGALVVTDRLHSITGDGLAPTLELIRQQSGNPGIESNDRIAEAECQNAHVNTAIAHVLADGGLLENPISLVLHNYFRQCAIAASAEDVARAALFLATRDGTNPVLDAESRRRVNAVLLTAGMYDAAGDIAYRVGIPAKSGIGGGIVGVLPSVGAVCAWSPPLDDRGNSAGGVVALEEFSRLAAWSIF
jgi:glutaminase